MYMYKYMYKLYKDAYILLMYMYMYMYICIYCVQLISPLPDISVVRSIQLLAWSAACGDVSLSSDPTSIHNAFTKVSTELHVMYITVHVHTVYIHCTCTCTCITEVMAYMLTNNFYAIVGPMECACVIHVYTR